MSNDLEPAEAGRRCLCAASMLARFALIGVTRSSIVPAFAYIAYG
jgi:hypothetical protein